jgi:aryl-alcohol dehydrogenase-like predicted oxidoreductase
MGFGAWSWGDRIFWSYGDSHSREDVEEAFNAAVEGGINFFDTAEFYGFGQSETILGRLADQATAPVHLATKLSPFPWRLTKKSLLRGVEGCLARLGQARIELVQTHWPISPLTIESWMKALAEAELKGIVHAIGLSNCNLSRMRRAQEALDRFGLKLASNQIHFSLLGKNREKAELLEACRKEGITFIAYSPLGQGLLTGKYTPERPERQGLMRMGNKTLIRELQPLIERMRQIGLQHGGKTPAQVALNWVICMGAVPIVGAKNKRQAEENIGAMGWRLSQGEVAELDEISAGLHQAFTLEPLVGL